MKAIQISSPGADFEIIEKEIPEPGNNEVLIKVEACGVCHGDSISKEGHFPDIKYPIIPGHEVVGIVHKVGSIQAGKQGKGLVSAGLVVIVINVALVVRAILEPARNP